MTETTIVDYREKRMWPLTSATTCYTGARQWHQEEESSAVYFASERHTFRLDLDHPGDVSCAEISSSTNDHQVLPGICVGYSYHDGHEVIVLLEQTERQPSGAVGGGGDFAAASSREFVPTSDEASIATTVATSTTAATGHHHHHHRSYSNLSTSNISIEQSVASTAAMSQESSPNFDVPHSQRAKLLLRNLESGIQYTAELDARPLCPVLCRMKDDLMIWCGSADHHKLQLWRPDQGSLVCMDIVNLSFVSPILSLDFIAADSTNCLAVGCQDGTIRLVTFDTVSESGSLENLSEHEVIVDGPIVCLHLVKTSSGFLNLTAGSLCGYVCELERVDDSSWKGPFLIAEGFWSDRLQAEDSVLAVYRQGDCVVIGTHSGRCLVYVKVNGVSELHWHCQLPYCVHGAILCDRGLVVTTRRSVHLFEGRKQLYSVDVARDRIRALLDQYWHEPNEEKDDPTPPQTDSIADSMPVNELSLQTIPEAPTSGSHESSTA